MTTMIEGPSSTAKTATIIDNGSKRHITQIYTSGSGSACLTIPKSIAEKFCLSKGVHILIEPLEKAIQIRNVEDKLN
jgi:hypothetical protein